MRKRQASNKEDEEDMRKEEEMRNEGELSKLGILTLQPLTLFNQVYKNITTNLRWSLLGIGALLMLLILL